MATIVTGNKEIARNSFFLYLRMILLMIVSLVSVRVVMRSLGIEDYGIYSVIGGVVTSFSFLSQTLVSASQRYFAYYLGIRDYDEFNKTYAAIQVVNIIIAIVLFILFESVGSWFVSNKMQIPLDKIVQTKFLFHTSVISFIFSLFTSPLVALIVANEDMKAYAYISLFEGLLKLGVALLLLILPFDKLKLYGLLLCAVSICMFVIYYFFCKKKYLFIKKNVHFSYSKLREIFNYSAWTLFGTIAGVANNQGINILLNIFFGPIANAAQAIAHQVSGILNQVCASFYSAVRPPLTKSYAIGDKSRCIDLFYFSNKILFFLLSLVTIPLYIEIEYILKIWLGEVNSYMVSFSRLLLINVTILCLSYPITTIVQAAGKVRLYHGIVDGFALLVLPVGYLVLKITENPDYVFYAANIIFIVAHFLRLIILKSVMVFSIKDYIFKFFTPAIIAVIISVFMVSLPIIEVGITRLIIRLLITLAIVSLTTYVLVLNINERQGLLKYLKYRIKKS